MLRGPAKLTCAWKLDVGGRGLSPMTSTSCSNSRTTTKTAEHRDNLLFIIYLFLEMTLYNEDRLNRKLEARQHRQTESTAQGSISRYRRIQRITPSYELFYIRYMYIMSLNLARSCGRVEMREDFI